VAEIVAEILDRKRFVVVDDVACEKTTEFVRQSLLHLVDEVYTRQKTLIVTSNLSLDQLGEFEPRVASRLAEMCDLYEFTEPDYRVRLAQQRAKLNLERPIGGVM
jgi:DNA replication protein DnaC